VRVRTREISCGEGKQALEIRTGEAQTEAFCIWKLKPEIEFEKVRLPVADGKGLENAQSWTLSRTPATTVMGSSGVLVGGRCPFGWGRGRGSTVVGKW
jgi:hypothetical protein